MEAANHSSSSGGGMIDMNDVSIALELVKGAERMGSVNSLASWRTAAATPDVSPPGSAGSSSSSSSDGEGGRGGVGGGGSGGRELPRRRSVRWGDEEGGELVSEVRTTPDFWEELVFGEGSVAGGGEPTELCRFITELTRGVEATLVFPSLGGVSKKRRRVVLYTDDNGVSISWLKRSGGGGGGSSKEPYRIRCETLLDVKDKTVAAAGAGGQACCEMSLKWLPQPTWSKRSVKMVDIQTESPGVFARGMLQLLSFNTDLQS